MTVTQVDEGSGASVPADDYVGHQFRRFDDGYAIFTDSAQVEEAIVFVHGFSGSATTTWRGVANLIGRSPHRFSRADAYFWDYNSVFQETAKSTGQLRTFLHQILPEPPMEMLRIESSGAFGRVEASVRPTPGLYTRLTLVGHSLGGLVVRRAVVDEVEDESSPLFTLLRDAGLILFAPATGGCRLVGLKMLLARSWGLRTLHMAVKATSASYAEMRDGATVQALKEATYAKRGDFPDASGFKAFNFWADDDKIVSQSAGRLINDLRHRTVLGKSHSDVCKPVGDYRLPVSVIEDPYLVDDRLVR